MDIASENNTLTERFSRRLGIKNELLTYARPYNFKSKNLKLGSNTMAIAETRALPGLFYVFRQRNSHKSLNRPQIDTSEELYSFLKGLIKISLKRGRSTISV